jgi:Holliday junction resolvase RusA-like endonuclease
MTSGPWSLSLEFHIRSAGVGDVDNLAGAILDALEGLLWANDRDVVDLNVRKVYDLKKGHQPWTSIECVPDDHA